MGRAQAGWAKGIFQTIAPGISRATCWGRGAANALAHLRSARSRHCAVEGTLKEVNRSGREFWEVREFQRIPGIGPMAVHIFSAIIEEPARFSNKHKLWKYAQLGITDRTSDNKPLGYQRLDRRGNRELKNLSYP